MIELKSLQDRLLAEIAEAADEAAVETVRIGALGKNGAVTALFTASGELLGLARALWIEPRA